MKNPELFNKTVSILVKAYMDNALNAMDCAQCACGNIVAAACGFDNSTRNRFIKNGRDIPVAWRERELIINAAERDRQVLMTGYTHRQLFLIESAFMVGAADRETNGFHWLMSIHNPESQNHFKGLMAVIDCLQEIHEATPQEAESAKLQFVKA